MQETPNFDLLVVDDDDEFRGLLLQRLTLRGFHVHEAPDAQEALGLGRRRQFDVAVFDMIMPGISGLELLDRFKGGHPECEVIMLTGQGSIETAVEAMKLGAYDYLTKPFSLADLEVLIHKAYEHHLLRKENRQLKTLLRRRQSPEEMVGQSPAWQEVTRLIQRAGPSEKAILIQGESGTGKELVAKALHQHSQRADKPLVVINCAALPETLLESELFGHEKGAFTGAINSKQGLFEVADGGTLLIDEIGEMPGTVQAKLLRVLEDGSLRRVGSLKQRRVNVRIVAATNRKLANEVQAGRFREDLYYRINVMSLELPPLRERTGDIPLLVHHFLDPGWTIDDEVIESLEGYHWPGNVRQLSNAIERAKIMSDGQTITLSSLPRDLVACDLAGGYLATGPRDQLWSIERSKIIDVLRHEGGNKTHAADTLGIDRRKLYRLLEKYEIRNEEFE